MNEQMTPEQKPKKRLSPLLIIPVLLIAAAAAVFLVFFRQNITCYTTEEDYCQAGGKLPQEIPETATDCRFAIQKTSLSEGYYYSFVLDKRALQNFTDQITSEHNVIDTVYGYAQWYYKKVSDCTDLDYELNNFPVHLPFNAVIDKPIEDYTIILYSPTGAGSRTSGVLMDKATGSVVVYQFEAAK